VRIEAHVDPPVRLQAEVRPALTIRNQGVHP
jgi:hypothetical protein